jgi:hypothetical protein
MAEEGVRELLIMTHARMEMQRSFLRFLLYRISRDVPEFSLELLSEALHLHVQNVPRPQTGEDADRELSMKTAHDELRKLIEMVEGAINDRRGDED